MEAVETQRKENKEVPGEFAITYDEAMEALRRRSGISVNSDDPLLDVVTLNNLYLDALHRLMSKHEGVMKDTMLDVVRDTVARFDEVVKLLRNNSVENALAVIRQHQEAMNEFRSAMGFLAFNVKIFCGVTLGASFLALIVVIFRLVRGA
jgi:hypothetical protein